MFESIEYEMTEGIAVVRLDRPDARNGLDEELLTELATALERTESDDDVYVLVITGNGTAFSAGGDIPTVRAWRTINRESFEAELEQYQGIVTQLRSMSTPSIAAVNGPAVGAGCDLALACDIRIVSPSAKLTEGFVNIGLISGDGGAWLLPRLIGEARAKEYLLTGNPIGADEAVDVGLATEQADELMERARVFAREIRNLPAEAVEQTKQLATVRPETFDDHLARATEAQWMCLQDDEHEETLDARLDGRAPDLDRPE